jgi:hypothetical protein
MMVYLSMGGRKGLPQMAEESARNYRLQVELSTEEIVVIDGFRFDGRYPTRAAAVRELLRRGLAEAERTRGQNPTD